MPRHAITLELAAPAAEALSEALLEAGAAARARRVQGGARALDYGCGSGILAIAAAKLGAREVSAVDGDPQALEVAQGNARVNGVALKSAAREAPCGADYDLVVANILAQPLIELECRRTGAQLH